MERRAVLEFKLWGDSGISSRKLEMYKHCISFWFHLPFLLVLDLKEHFFLKQEKLEMMAFSWCCRSVSH